MPQLNSDEAANDEPKTYRDEAICGDDGWQDSKDLNDIKGDLVCENDGDPIPRLYDNNVDSHKSADEACRSKNIVDQDHRKDIKDAVHNFPYPQQNISSVVSGLGHTLFPNSFLPPSSQLPYSAYMPPCNIGPLLCGRNASVDFNGKQGSYPDVPSMYSLPGQLGQIPNPLAPWSPGPLYPLCTATAMAGMLHYPYPFHPYSSAPGTPSTLPLVPPNRIHHTLLHPGPLHKPGHVANVHDRGERPPADEKAVDPGPVSTKPPKSSRSRRPYVKKPLNAFMIFMKEQRAKVVSEGTLKESAAINQILGRKWHSLDRTEQQKYFEMAQKERQVHMQLFPGWSARENYGKRKKRRKNKSPDCSAQTPKKCRAVFGLEDQQEWCAPCRRKKRCVRYQHDGDGSEDSEDPPGSFQHSPIESYSHNNGIHSVDPTHIPTPPDHSSSAYHSKQTQLARTTGHLSSALAATTDPIKREQRLLNGQLRSNTIAGSTPIVQSKEQNNPASNHLSNSPTDSHFSSEGGNKVVGPSLLHARNR